MQIGGVSVTSTAAELNIIDGGTSATSTTLVDADRVVVNDDGTMVQVAMTDFKTYINSNLPSSADGQALGSTSSEWSDLYLADSSVIYFGNDQDITLTHNPDAGLTLKNTATADDKYATFTLQAGDTDIAANDKLGAINFQAPDEGTGTDAILVAAGIEAVSEGDFSSSSNATKLSFKTASSAAAAETMSLSSAGNLAVTGTLSTSTFKTGGTNCIAIGTDAAGSGLSSKTDSVAIGVYSGYNLGSYSVFVGKDANQTASGNPGSDYSVAIGERSLRYFTGDNNVAIGSGSMSNDSGSTGTDNVCIGHNSGDVLTTGNYNVILGSGSDPSSATASNQIVIGYGATGQANNSVTLGNADVTAVYCAQDSGASVYAAAFYCSSDLRLKTNIVELENCIDKIKQIRGVNFDWIETNEPDCGVIAQDIEKVLPLIVKDGRTGYKTVDYSRITPLLIQTCKEQQSLIENQQTQIEDLHKKIDQYKNDVDSLKIEFMKFKRYRR